MKKSKPPAVGDVMFYPPPQEEEDRNVVITSWKRDLAILKNHRNMSRLTPEVSSYVDGKIQMLELCIAQLRSLLS